jgi:hypothetical protein
MQIKLARIDDRLIHGQVATVWAKEALNGLSFLAMKSQMMTFAKHW